MITVGLTGGIGSGKTTVAKFFEKFGIPVYVADIEAKQLMHTSAKIKAELIALFGKEAYTGNTLNRTFLADKIFNDKMYLDKMNAIVHPKVEMHFKEWLKQQHAPYVLKEAAIIFEHQKQSQYDLIILVIADKNKRLERVIKRDKSSPEKVQAIMDNQLNDKEKAKLSDFVILNNSRDTLESQVQAVHRSILARIENSKN